VQILFDTRHRMVRGSFVVLGKKCGKPTCACAQGALHPSRYLSASEQGRTRMAYVPAAAAATVKAAADRYQRFRRARAEVVKLSAHTVELADRLQVALSDAYPTQAAPRRRRRSAKEEDGGGGEEVGG
jgi:hypothetical protein